MQQYLEKLIDPQIGIKSIADVTPSNQNEMDSSRDNFDAMTDLYKDKILEICRSNKQFAPCWSIVWHDVRNQFGSVFNMIQYSFFEQTQYRGTNIYDVFKSEVEALGNMLNIIDRTLADPNTKFTLRDLAGSIHIPAAEKFITGDVNCEFDFATLFSIRTVVLNSKGKSGKIKLSKVIIHLETDDNRTLFRIYDDATQAWEPNHVNVWMRAYKSGWEQATTVTEATEQAGSIVAYTAGQRAQRVGLSDDMLSAASLLKYVDNASNTEQGLTEGTKYAEITFPKHTAKPTVTSTSQSQFAEA